MGGDGKGGERGGDEMRKEGEGGEGLLIRAEKLTLWFCVVGFVPCAVASWLACWYVDCGRK